MVLTIRRPLLPLISHIEAKEWEESASSEPARSLSLQDDDRHRAFDFPAWVAASQSRSCETYGFGTNAKERRRPNKVQRRSRLVSG